jgi:glutathionylspermidine synthase
MELLTIEPRAGWQQKIAEQGLIYWETEMPDGEVVSYWEEGRYYTLRTAEVYEFEGVARQIVQDMLVAAGDYIIERDMFARLGIPEWCVPAIKETWNSEPPMLYGRFDFAYVDGVPKLLEFNADTPTCLMETAVQWFWVQDQLPGFDQWNRVHEALVERWAEMLKTGRVDDVLHLLHTNAEMSGEDFMTTAYLAETARQAGITTKMLPVESLELRHPGGFFDLEGEPVRTAFKLYPWEWMVHERFGQQAVERMGRGPGKTQWIEPIWKMLWSNKGILPVLWELFPGHDNLLPAFFEDQSAHAKFANKSFVRKPLLAREGANTTIVINGEGVAEEGPDQGYGEEGFVLQQFVDLGTYEGMHPVMGVWVVDMEPAGLGIRHSPNLITNNLSRFAPHAIVD